MWFLVYTHTPVLLNTHHPYTKHTRLVSPATVQLATQQRQQLPFTVRPGAEQVLHAVSITPAREDKPSAVAGGHGARNTPGQGVSGEGMFRSASKPLGSRRSSALGHAGSLPAQERRAKVGDGVDGTVLMVNTTWTNTTSINTTK